MEQTDRMYVPIINAWQLNERSVLEKSRESLYLTITLKNHRHYGALQGLDKKETVKKYGIDQVNIWRRSYDIPPPECETDSEHFPGNDPKYAGIPEASKVRTESLKVASKMPSYGSNNFTVYNTVRR
jgi:2,3-bisphosphoglycerate-dependent phosphoglycerate mutase